MTENSIQTLAEDDHKLNETGEPIEPQEESDVALNANIIQLIKEDDKDEEDLESNRPLTPLKVEKDFPTYAEI